MKETRRRLVALAITAAALGGPPLSAQVVRGRVLDPTTGEGVNGAVVALEDGDGGARGYVLTHADGSYILRAPMPGRYRVLMSRIGFEDVATDPFELRTGEILWREVSATVQVIPLEGMRVTGKARCVVRPDLGQETVALWSAIRTALAATSATRDERVLRYEVGSYTQDLDPESLRETGPVRSRLLRGLAEHPFEPAPVDDLMREGFVRAGDEESEYFAPDAEVILSRGFLDTHCFRAVPLRSSQEDGRPLAGLAFRPIGHRTVPDVEGTLWVDGTTLELRTLQYRYTGLDVPDADKVGGEVEFARLPDGRWIVSRWYVRMPVVTRAPRSPRSSDPLPSQRALRRLDKLIEGGGAVLSAREASGSQQYTAAPEVWAKLFPAVTRPSVKDSEAVSAPGVTGADVAAKITPCDGVADTRGSGGLRGTVRRQNSGDPVPRSTVVVEWVGASPVGGGLETSRSTPERAEAITDDRGRYVLCGLPIRTALTVYALPSGGDPVRTRVNLSGTTPRELDLVLPEVTHDQGRSATPGREVGSVVGHVVDAETRRPLPGAQLLLKASADSAVVVRSALTGADGRAAMQEVPVGTYQLAVASVGYEPVEHDIEVEAAAVRTIEIAILSVPVPIEGLVVEGRISATFGGFYQRRARNMGSYIARAEIEAATTARASDLVRRVPGIQVICPGVSIRCVLRTSAVPSLAGADKGDCPIQYFVDGTLTPEFELDDLRPEEIEGIEVYTHAATVPSRFNIGEASRCGVMVVWTAR